MPGGGEGPALAGCAKGNSFCEAAPDVKLRVGSDHLVSTFIFIVGHHPVLSARFVILLFALD